MYGLSDDEIAALLRGDSAKFSAPEQALIQMADALSGAPVNVSNELYAELRRHFSEEQLIELAADAAQENYRARWNRVFDVGSDALYCAIPDRSIT
jgi:alkylhydroperoxidase family enzyme